MALQVTSTIKASTTLYKVGATLTSITPIVTPEYFVIHDEPTRQEVIAKAGLPSTVIFVQAVLIKEGYVGNTYYYDLFITIDNFPVTATSHFHDSSTLNHPLREAYRDGPYIDLDPSLGPVDIYAPSADTVDYLRIHIGTSNLFFIRRDGTISVGAPIEFDTDTTYDIGSVDSGVTLRRPRDLYVGRDTWTARSGYFGTSAKSPVYLFFPQATNPDSLAADRHLYWNSVDNKPHVWNGLLDYPLNSCDDCDGISVLYDGPTVDVGDAVTMAGLNAVIQADASLSWQNPVIGVCIEKPTPLVALVQLSGEVNVFPASLTPGAKYFLDKSAGAITTDVSAFVTGDVVQLLGIAKTDSTLTLAIGTRTIL